MAGAAYDKQEWGKIVDEGVEMPVGTKSKLADLRRRYVSETFFFAALSMVVPLTGRLRALADV